MKPWGTPALTLFHVGNCTLRNTRYFFHLKSHVKGLVHFLICHFELA